MENYEINILRRDGNWKKLKPKDLLLDTVDQNDLQKSHMNNKVKVDLESEYTEQDSLLYYINKVNLIIGKLETLENEKTDLKNQLKKIENKFQSKKKVTEEKIKVMSKESEMLEKTISIIKNLKNF